MPFLSAKEEGGALSQHQSLPSSDLPTLRKTSRIPSLSLVARHPTLQGFGEKKEGTGQYLALAPCPVTLSPGLV